MRQLPSDSRTVLSVNGDRALWSSTDHLLAAVLDALNAGNWQRGGGKGHRPKRTPRPGEADRTTVRHGRTDRPAEEVRAYLARFRPRAEEVSACQQE